MKPRRPSIGSKDLGDHAESLAKLLLRERGYNADLHRINNPVYYLCVDATKPFNVSVNLISADLQQRGTETALAGNRSERRVLCNLLMLRGFRRFGCPPR